jgi:MEMO1 family protein
MNRRANHAGSWYEFDADKLGCQLKSWKDNVQCDLIEGDLKCVIGPHAGYAYSGQAAAWIYAPLEQYLHSNPDLIKRVIVLGPSHHLYLDRCALSQCHRTL